MVISSSFYHYSLAWGSPYVMYLLYKEKPTAIEEAMGFF